MTDHVKSYEAMRPSEDPTPDQLRALIARTGLSQRKAAEALDLDERTLRYYASGDKPIPRVVIFALEFLAITQPNWNTLLPSEPPTRLRSAKPLQPHSAQSAREIGAAWLLPETPIHSATSAERATLRRKRT